MAVWAQQGQIRRVVIAPIAVYVFHLYRNLAGHRVSLGPAASAALLANCTDQILAKKVRRRPNRILPALEQSNPIVKLFFVLAPK
jgi:hypothetical protein